MITIPNPRDGSSGIFLETGDNKMNDADTSARPSKPVDDVQGAALIFMMVLCMSIYCFISIAPEGIFAVFMGMAWSAVTAAFFVSFVTKSINLIKILLQAERVTSSESFKTE